MKSIVVTCALLYCDHRCVCFTALNVMATLRAVVCVKAVYSVYMWCGNSQRINGRRPNSVGMGKSDPLDVI